MPAASGDELVKLFFRIVGGIPEFDGRV